MHNFILASCAALFASAGAAQATERYTEDGPSYACYGRLTDTERAICSDPHLSQLDRVMARLYYVERDLSSRERQRHLKRDQRIWLDWRDTCGADRGCLQRRYEQRILDLAPPGRVPPDFGCGGQGTFLHDAVHLLPPA